jgi:hypothetical protein
MKVALDEACCLVLRPPFHAAFPISFQAVTLEKERKEEEIRQVAEVMNTTQEVGGALGIGMLNGVFCLLWCVINTLWHGKKSRVLVLYHTCRILVDHNGQR